MQSKAGVVLSFQLLPLGLSFDWEKKNKKKTTFYFIFFMELDYSKQQMMLD